MIKSGILFFLLLAPALPLFAQFNDVQAKKSVVRIQVDGMVNGKKDRGICTGFIWKDPSMIVTALHAMKPNQTILVFYPGGQQRPAQVVKVFKNGDLVLLKTATPPSPSGDIVPLHTFQENVTTGEKLTAMGFYGGAQAKTTQSLDKGSADPETVQAIAPIALENEIKKIEYPSITYKIYYLSGSLLPGYSGCPIFNQRTELIGIGDGGLDKGQINVSWAIPASSTL